MNKKLLYPPDVIIFRLYPAFLELQYYIYFVNVWLIPHTFLIYVSLLIMYLNFFYLLNNFTGLLNLIWPLTQL